MAKAETLSDNFDDNSLSGSWTTTVDTAVTVTEVSGQIQISLPNASGRYGYLKSASNYDLTDSVVGSQLISVGSQTNMDCFPVFILNGTDWAGWNVTGNVVVAHTNIGGVDTDRGTNMTYSSTLHRFFRCREIAGTFYWQWSSDGKGWATHASLSTASIFAMTSVQLQLQAGFWGAPGTTTIAKFDNFNRRETIARPTNALRPKPFAPGLAR